MSGPMASLISPNLEALLDARRAFLHGTSASSDALAIDHGGEPCTGRAGAILPQRAVSGKGRVRDFRASSSFLLDRILAPF